MIVKLYIQEMFGRRREQSPSQISRKKTIREYFSLKKEGDIQVF